jgi:hypothetical protein
MLDARIRTLAREGIEIAVEERWAPLEMEVSKASSEFATAGRAGSGSMYLHIFELYQNELDIQVSMAWGQLQKVLATVGIGSMDHLATDLKAFMAETFEWITSGLCDRLRHSPFLRQGRDHVVRFDERKAHAIRKVYSEVDLFVAGLEQAARVAQNGGATHVNIYGSQVGILQTGASSTASMTVHLDSTSKQEITKALNTVEKALGEAAHVPFDRGEISEMIRESQSELDKPRPNVSRLRSLMQGVATSIQTVASLRPAYDAIKGGLALLGVTLP